MSDDAKVLSDKKYKIMSDKRNDFFLLKLL